MDNAARQAAGNPGDRVAVRGWVKNPADARAHLGRVTAIRKQTGGGVVLELDGERDSRGRPTAMTIRLPASVVRELAAGGGS